MTENKRFTINTLDGSVDLRDNGKVMTYKQTVEILNNLSEENEHLKQQLCEKGIQLDFLKSENTHMKTVLAENRELKTLNNAYLQDLEVLKSKVNDVTVAVEIATEEQMQKVFKTIDEKIEQVNTEKYKAINRKDVPATLCFVAMLDLLNEVKKELQDG